MIVPEIDLPETKASRALRGIGVTVGALCAVLKERSVDVERVAFGRFVVVGVVGSGGVTSSAPVATAAPAVVVVCPGTIALWGDGLRLSRLGYWVRCWRFCSC